ncbi:MAG: lipoyl(octanoyl) transferase LipB [Candidatus Omnitrophica bacterium]|nr:lipoyl(octanoyl) transferase LipB [Candidatus Omnitrophota bacterium]
MRIIDPGLIGYEESVKLQEALLHKRIKGDIGDTLIMLEHGPVVTLGRIDSGEGLVDRRFFSDRRIPVLSTSRGGNITIHMPGQLVLYPVIDLSDKKKDVSFYIDFLEKTVSRALNRFGVPAERTPERRGVWVSGRKIAFTGIGVKRWVTYHGSSVNINNDLEPFRHIYPCGEQDIQVTSAKEFLGQKLDMDEVKRVFREEFRTSMEREYGKGNMQLQWN